jgi:hypothetical protein
MIIQEGDKVIMVIPLVAWLKILFGINEGNRYFLNGCRLFPLGWLHCYSVALKVLLRGFVVAAIIYPVALAYCGGKVFPRFGVNV